MPTAVGQDARPPAGGALWRAAVVSAALSAAAGCATFSDEFAAVEQHLAARQYDQALQALDRLARKPRDRVLTLLNRGMVLRMRGDLAASNQALEEAKAVMDSLYGASVTEQGLSFIINDATRSYAGEEHEQVLVHLYKALNFLELGERDAARVEALQVDVRLREVAERLPSASYAEIAFARYLTGLIYEDLGEWSDALIACRKAYEAYVRQQPQNRVEVPAALKHDLLRLTERQGLTAETRKYKSEFGVASWMSARDMNEQGEAVFILHNGLAPILRESSVTAPDLQSGHLVRISLPYHESRPVPVARFELSAGERRAGGEIVEDIDALARQHLDGKLPAITARAVARQVAKAQMAKSAREYANQQENPMGGLVALVVEIGGVASERADTRSWATLPHDIQLARLPLPPGRHTLRVELYGDYNELIASLDYPDIEIRAGRKTYLSQHWIPTFLPPRRR